MSEVKYMARLIDAGKLNFHCNYNGDCLGDISHCKECYNYVLDYRDIQEQPIAYDVNKVVEQLRKQQEKLETDIFAKESDNWYGQYCNGIHEGIDKAIEIVKAGGKNDD